MATATLESVFLTERATLGIGRVDTTSHVIHGVKVLGRFSKNGREYSEAAIAGAVGLYEGSPVFLDHPKGSPSSPRSYAERVGTLRNVRLQEGSLIADLHYNPAHPIAPQLEHDAEHSPQSVGLSHNVEVRSSKGANGKLLVNEIVRVQSVDLVATPATTNGLYEHCEPEWSTEGFVAAVAGKQLITEESRTEFVRTITR